MCLSQDCSTWSFIAASRLDSNEAVLNNVDTSNAVFAGKLVECKEDVDWVRDGGGSGRAKAFAEDFEFLWHTSGEVQGDPLWGIRCFLNGLCEFPHVCWRRDIGIFKNTSFVRDVEEILVGGPGLCSGLGDWDTALSCEL